MISVPVRISDADNVLQGSLRIDLNPIDADTRKMAVERTPIAVSDGDAHCAAAIPMVLIF